MTSSVSIIQGIYYLVTGIWPLFDRSSFEKVTGPKDDFWLVKTVGLLVSVVGGILVSAGLRQRVTGEIAALAVGSSASLIAVDIVYVTKKRILPTYLLDAVGELVLMGLWIISLGRENRA